ncbi:hemerythrin domain-containing protein [Frankia sp. AgB32]|uniref:hemerythrin domain-containing protein n=1 Tax=Frankia sp. AgB32 TaxID=631119 RepID=UPI00200C15EC|nr:hemerythrin domain-containing protein [Frankia sp. AgB32]MCK9896661.1 hemerythrin domain-containing protein [Frankia sp. AgB32]
MAEALMTLVDAAHSDAARLVGMADGLGAAAGPSEGPASDPRQALHASDAAVAAISAHLGVMEAVVYPELAHRVPGSRARVAELGRLARRCSSVMRGIEQYVQGDLKHPADSVASLRHDLAGLLEAHTRAEDDLLREFDARLTDPERDRLLGRFAAAMRHAPTRPHPHLGHGGAGRGSLALRLLGTVDHLLDVMDAREVAGAPVREPAPAGLWGWYLLGRPTSVAPEWPASESSASEMPGTSAEPAGQGTDPRRTKADMP